MIDKSQDEPMKNFFKEWDILGLKELNRQHVVRRKNWDLVLQTRDELALAAKVWHPFDEVGLQKRYKEAEQLINTYNGRINDASQAISEYRRWAITTTIAGIFLILTAIQTFWTC